MTTGRLTQDYVLEGEIRDDLDEGWRDIVQ